MERDFYDRDGPEWTAKLMKKINCIFINAGEIWG
jgi:hypothetical protein